MTTLPAALRNYIQRIGAEELNFRRFMIRTYRGAYYTEKVLIRITEDGEVFCSDKEHAPTKEEAIAIKAAVETANFPKATKVSARKAREAEKLGGGKDSVWYPLFDRMSGQVVMVQERTRGKDGTKIFVPWTYFSDGQWRRMEPDGALPFWKPEKARGLARIMVHEGAKAAAAADRISVDRKSTHPWAGELAAYEHWGIIGGALAPHRADYESLRREAPVEVVYVCDNDFPGKAVLQEFSRHYGGKLRGVMFDVRWPGGWDIADAMPEGLYEEGRYLGPSLEMLAKPATWATEQVFSGERGKPAVVLTRPFREEWVHSVIPEAYIHVEHSDQVYNGSEFNNAVRPFSHVQETSRLVQTDAATKSVFLKYSPGKPSGIYVDADTKRRYINTWMPTTVEREDGDAGPWLEFVERLVPGEADRRELLRWCATLVALPSRRMAYGALLISETQGVGKGTLGEKILAPLVGMANVSFPAEKEIVDSAYNYWLSHKRLAVVHEIYAGHSAKAYNELKSVITDRFVTVNRKYMASYELENWVHVLACSNSRRALQLSMDDRRWFVPALTEEKATPKYWAGLNLWLYRRGGLGIVRQWAHEYVETEGGSVEEGTDAPWTGAKKDVVEEGYSPGMELVAAFLSRVREKMNGDRVVMVDADHVKLIRRCLYDDKSNDKLERPLTIRKVAKGAGWHVGTKPIPYSLGWGNGTPSQKARMIVSDPKDINADPRDLAAAGIRPLDVAALAEEFGFMYSKM